VLNIGPQELLVILLVALVIVGPQRLPELSRTIGRGLREFRKAQDDVKKTIRLGLDETEPTARRTPNPATTAEALPDRSGPAVEPSSAPPADDAADVARSLGRGLAEIRRARREIQRTFRVDLSDPPAPAPRPPAATTSQPLTPAPTPEPAEPPTPGADPGPAGSGTPA